MLGAGVNLQGRQGCLQLSHSLLFHVPVGPAAPTPFPWQPGERCKVCWFCATTMGPYLSLLPLLPHCSHATQQGARSENLQELVFFSVNKARPLHAQDHSGKMLPESGSLVTIIENFGSSVLVSALLNFMQAPGFTKQLCSIPSLLGFMFSCRANTKCLQSSLSPLDGVKQFKSGSGWQPLQHPSHRNLGLTAVCASTLRACYHQVWNNSE